MTPQTQFRYIFGMKVNEALEVAAVFRGGRAEPVAFRWGQSAYRVKKVNLYHPTRLGQELIHCFSVSTDNENVFEISFNPHKLSWKINQIE